MVVASLMRLNTRDTNCCLFFLFNYDIIITFVILYVIIIASF